MAVTQNTYTGNGSTVLFSFTFPYLETTDIKVSVNGTNTTAYTLANATTIQFNTAPANGAAIRIYRQTDDAALAATFYPGSAIRSSDLNENFTQNLYVTQESSNNATTATTTANTALTNSNTAISTANSAVSTANTASSNASAAVATANTASSNASAAVSTANTASSNATTAVNTANAATATANSAASDAATALSTANAATSTANAASTAATNAVNTANAASSAASSAVSTANTASTNASNAVTTANTASSNATTAVNTANSAVATANSAAAAVANAVIYTIVANVAAIPASPSNNTAIEVANSTGIESFTPLAGKPGGFVGNSGLSVRIIYSTSGSTWNWVQYFPNDPEARYLKLAGGTVTGNLAVDGTLTKSGNNVVTTGDTGTVTSTMIADGTIVNADINASAAIAGTKISPDFGSQTVTTTGVISTAAGAAATPSITFTGDLNTGIYSPGADQVAISTAGSGRLFVNAGGDVGVRSAAVGFPLEVRSRSTTDSAQVGLTALNWSTNYSSTYLQLFDTAATGSTFGISNANSGQLVFQNHANAIIGTNNATPIIFATQSSERLRITSAGLVGVGTSSVGARLDVVETYATSALLVRHSGTTGGGAAINVTNGVSSTTPVYGFYYNGTTGIGNPAANVISAIIDGSEKVRCDSSGRLLVGTSTSAGNNLLQIKGDTSGSTGVGSIFLQRGLNIATIGSSGNVDLAKIEFGNQDGAVGAVIQANADATWSTNDYPSRLTFSTTADGASSPTERLRISNNGYVGINGTASRRLEVFDTRASEFAAAINNESTTGHALALTCKSSDTVGIYLNGYSSSANTTRINIYSNGNILNSNNSYGALSDARLKDNITDASSQWDDIKAVQVRNYNLKTDPDHRQIGVVAQEIEQVSPGLVYESPDRDAQGNDLGTVTKSVNYSVLYMKAVKALQEAMERIETLEAKVAALESA